MSPGHRPSEEIALCFLATDSFQQFSLNFLFDTLGHHAHFEALCQLNDGLDDALAAMGEDHLVDERLVDFQAVHLEALEVLER